MELWDAVRDTLRAAGAAACGVTAIGPSEALPGMRTAVCAAFSYLAEDRDAPICRYARGRDYHRALTEAMEPAAAQLRQAGFQARTLADTSPLPEVRTALQAGLGVLGENGLLIVPGAGSWVVLGFIVTDAEPPAAEPAPLRRCRGCGACRRACPAGALSEKGVDADRCLSAVTQRKGELTPGEEAMMRRVGTLWGCDVCQRVCPENRGAQGARLAVFREDLIDDLKPADLEGLSNRTLKEKYPDRAFTWRGPAVLRRNAQVIHGDLGRTLDKQ